MPRPRDVMKWLVRQHLAGSMAMIVVVMIVMGSQVENRADFASSELHADVMDRWGAPITQAVPSLRYVESGAVFNALQVLSFESQRVHVDAAMNYRKRGLIYFSGFDFGFRGTYVARNPLDRDIDAVFVFPIDMQKNKVLLSELTFNVDGRQAPTTLGAAGDRLTWTGRIPAGTAARFEIAFRGRGLDSFTYVMDPSLPARDVEFTVSVVGGDNFDYPPGVAPAADIRTDADRTVLRWNYAALESGIPLGLILPAEQAWDHLLATMIRRSWATFALFMVAMAALVTLRGRRMDAPRTYLVAATLAFFYVLLPYLAAYLDFGAAYVLALVLVGGPLLLFVRGWLGKVAVPAAAVALVAFLVVPTLAVICQGYTGLIYSVEILCGLGAAMAFTTHRDLKPLVDHLDDALNHEADHAR